MNTYRAFADNQKEDKMRIEIELEFNEEPTREEVISYLLELIENECLEYKVKGE